MICKFDEVVRLRLSINDMNWMRGQYISKTINIKEKERKNKTLKLNMINGFAEKCQCEKCNPITTNEDRSKWTGA